MRSKLPCIAHVAGEDRHLFEQESLLMPLCNAVVPLTHDTPGPGRYDRRPLPAIVALASLPRTRHRVQTSIRGERPGMCSAKASSPGLRGTSSEGHGSHLPQFFRCLALTIQLHQGSWTNPRPSRTSDCPLASLRFRYSRLYPHRAPQNSFAPVTPNKDRNESRGP